jgi:hypothetical protein
MHSEFIIWTINMKFFLQGTINMKLTQSFAIVFYKWFPSCDEHFQCIWLTWHIITVLPIRIQCLWGTKTKWTWRDEMKIKFRKEMSNEIILYAGVQIEQFSKPQQQHQLWNWLYLYTSSSFYTATEHLIDSHSNIYCYYVWRESIISLHLSIPFNSNIHAKFRP